MIWLIRFDTIVAHEGQREEIAWAGYERSQREHTYEHRFQEILQTIGFL